MGKEAQLRPTSKHLAGSDQGRSRVVIENLQPEIDCGRFAAKRTVRGT